jgi:hypothetical protein
MSMREGEALEIFLRNKLNARVERTIASETGKPLTEGKDRRWKAINGDGLLHALAA